MKRALTITLILILSLASFGQISDPADTTACEGTNAIFSVSASYPDSSLIWQKWNSNAWMNLTGTNNDTIFLYSVNSALNNSLYRCVAQDSNSIIIDSSISARLTVLFFSYTPASASASINPVMCPGNKTILSVTGGSLGSGALWEWFTDSCNGKSEGTASGQLSVYPENTIVYYVRAKGSCNSTPCVSIPVIVSNTNSTDPGGIMSTVNPLCKGQTATLTVSGGSLGTGAKWKWYSGSSCNDTFIGQGATITIKPTDTAKYFVKAEGTCNTTNCANITIFVNTLPLINAGNDTSVCIWYSVGLKPKAPGAISYNWSPAIGLNDPNVLNPKASPVTVTHYVILVTDTNNCSNTDTIKITINPLPIINAGADTSICKGGSAQLKIIKGGASYKYKWVPSKGLSDSTIADPKAAPGLTTQYTVIITDSNGCKNSDDIKIAVNPLPAANAGKDVTICEGGTTQLIASGGIFYTWNDSITIDIPNISNPKAKPSKTKIYKVTVGNIYGCTNADSVKITVNALPNADAGIDKAICIGNNIQLDAKGGSLYNWSPATGLNTATGAKVTANPLVSISYTVLVTDNNGCSRSDDVKVTVNLLPSVKTSSDTILCEGADYKLSATPNLKKYDWKQNGTAFSQIRDPLVSPTQPQTTYTVIGTDINNCQNTDSVVVKIISNPRPKISSADTIVCKNRYWAGYCVNLTSNSFTWSVDNGTIITGQGTNCIKVHWSDKASGKVSVIEKLKTIPSCSGAFSSPVKMKDGIAPPQANVIAKANSIATKTLVCQFCSYKIFIWGYEDKVPMPSEKISGRGNTWCTYASIDTFKYNYWVKVGNDSGCLTKSYFNPPRFVNGIEPYLNNNHMSLFPNPTSGKITIESTSPVKEMEIYNLFGVKINTTISEGSNNQKTLDLTDLAKGIYFIRIQTKDGMMEKKIIKQ